ncbi:MAG: 5-(carboxyamino)imidazole ribonucleotide synthase [Phycisphaeraceae bacterium]
MSRLFPPGSRIGMFGGGQLGRMFALAARSMGYEVQVFVSEADAPASQVTDRTIVADYHDLDAVTAFARGVDVLTLEFENLPAASLAAAARHTPLHPGAAVLETTQHRLREKTTLERMGLPVTPFAAVHNLAELRTALDRLGTPAVLKTAAWGYDGKGQVRLDTPAEADAAWQSLDTDEAILESFVDFERELSIVVARSADGSFAHYGLSDNRHEHHILDLSLAPADVPEQAARDTVEIARTIMEGLDVVGVLCVELFLTRGGQVLINELAPRPHNSGHLTIDACVTSQFEQQVRAVCGLPLGSTRQFGPAVMANLLGDLWETGQPQWARACAWPEVKLHLYGKAEPRPKRKMGHLTALGDTVEQALQRATDARHALTGSK